MTQSTQSSSDSFPTPQAILETVVYCDDLDSAREFYEGVLGLALASEETGRHLFFRLDRSMLLVFNAKRTREELVRVRGQAIPQHGASGQSHVAFQVGPEQIDRIKAKLIDDGIEIESQIDWPGGGQSIYCRDPANNSVEFATRELWFR